MKLARARCPTLSVAVVGVLALFGSAAVGWLFGILPPKIHDEFSYLLAADTFANGRITNPTHLMWQHFESIHIIQRPTYMSKFPPGQGLFMALGQLIGGHPVVGVWLSMGSMAAAICWMLLGWVPIRWALYGSILLIVHPEIGVGGYWAQSYWGGAVAATGGALVLGGARRLRNRPKWQYAICIGLGLALLANSRPYEGVLLSFPLFVGFCFWIFGKNAPTRVVAIRQIITPIALILLATAVLMAYYNWRITGAPFLLPYQLHEKSYALAPNFLWQDPFPEPVYRHSTIRDFHRTYALTIYHEQRTLNQWLAMKSSVFAQLTMQAFTVFAVLLVPVIRRLRGSMFKNRWSILVTCIYLVFIAGLSLETFAKLHYIAPIVGLNFLMITKGARAWYRFDGRLGRAVIIFVPILSLVISFALCFTTYLGRGSQWQYRREEIAQELNDRTGRHLVIVNYGPEHSYHEEWVYNAAEIDSAKVVWARTMGVEQDCRLMKYFTGRHYWLLNVGGQKSQAVLKTYPHEGCMKFPPFFG